MKNREQVIAWHRQYCRHYTTGPGLDLSCAAGVDMSKLKRVAPLGDGFRSAPCIHGDQVPNVLDLCPKWEQESREAAEEHADRAERSMERLRLVLPLLAEWSTWKKTNRVGKSEVVECPACKGRLHLSQAARNGHLWAKCETEGCVELIQ